MGSKRIHGWAFRGSPFFLRCNACDIFIAHMNAILLRFEKSIGLGATYAARLLGVAYPTYAQYRSGRRELPLYHERHIEALLRLSDSELIGLIEKHGYTTKH